MTTSRGPELQQRKEPDAFRHFGQNWRVSHLDNGIFEFRDRLLGGCGRGDMRQPRTATRRPGFCSATWPMWHQFTLSCAFVGSAPTELAAVFGLGLAVLAADVEVGHRPHFLAALVGAPGALQLPVAKTHLIRPLGSPECVWPALGAAVRWTAAVGVRAWGRRIWFRWWPGLRLVRGGRRGWLGRVRRSRR